MSKPEKDQCCVVSLIREIQRSPHLNWVNNRVLLCSTGNSAQGHVVAWMRGEFGGERKQAKVWRSPRAVQLRLSQRFLLIGCTPTQNKQVSKSQTYGNRLAWWLPGVGVGVAGEAAEGREAAVARRAGRGAERTARRPWLEVLRCALGRSTARRSASSHRIHRGRCLCEVTDVLTCLPAVIIYSI